MKRFASWAAVSSLPQAKKISLEDQLTTNKEHIDRHEGELVAELVVPGESRNIVLFEDAARRIDAYAQLYELIRQRAFDVLIYLDRSRLGRKASLSMAVVELCHEAGILTYETESPPASLDDLAVTYDGQLVGAMKSVGAQRQIQKLVEDHKKGMLDRVRKGHVPSGVPPYGYLLRHEMDGNKIKKIVETDEPAAFWIRKMFDWYLTGVGFKGIADRLNSAGSVSPTGKPWTRSLTKSVVFRAWRYAGYGEMNRDTKTDRPYLRAKGDWPAIIDESTVERIFSERDQRIANRHIVETPYLLTGVVWCESCNHPMHVNANRRATPSTRIQMQLRCRATAHEFSTISYRRVVGALRAAIEALQNSNLVDLAGDDDSYLADLQTAVSAQETIIQRANAGLRRADDAFTSGIMDIDRYRRQTERFNAQIAQAESEMERLYTTIDDEKARGTRRQRLEDAARVGLAMLDNQDATAANAWLRTYVRVWVRAHQVVGVEWL